MIPPGVRSTESVGKYWALLQELKNELPPATFGDLRNRENKQDSSVRKGLSASITLRNDAKLNEYIKTLVHQNLFMSDPRAEITLVADKVNYYQKGDHFDWHVDSPTHPTMVGTVILYLNSSEVAPELSIREPHSTSEHHIFNCITQSNCIKLVAFFSDCPHKVTKKTKDVQTITFKLLCSWKPIVYGSQKTITAYFKNNAPQIPETQLLQSRINQIIKKCTQLLELADIDSFGILSQHDAILGCPQPLRLQEKILFDALQIVWPQTRVIPVLDSRSFTPGGEDSSDTNFKAVIYPVSMEDLHNILNPTTRHKQEKYESSGDLLILDSNEATHQIGKGVDTPTYWAGNHTELGSFSALYFRSLIIVSTKA